MHVFNELSQETMDKVFVPLVIEEHDPTLPYEYVDCRTASLYCFSGSKSSFTPTCQDGMTIPIDGKEYPSVDDYVWQMKFLDLTGHPPLSSHHFRADLSRRGVNVTDLENWVLKRGLLYMQKAILCKLQNDKSFYQQLMRTGDKYIMYTYNKETFYSTGTPKDTMCEWLEFAAKSNFHLRIPLRFPLLYQDLRYTPLMPNNGHNVLGLIYMAIREAIQTKGLRNLTVDIPANDPTCIPQNVKIAVEKYLRQVSNPQTKNLTIFPEHLFGFPPPSISGTQTGYAQTSASSRTTTKPNRQNDRPHPSTSSIYTTNSNLGSQQFQSNSAHQSMKSTRRPLIVPKEENFYGETYSTMSTSAVSSACPSVLNARNWQTEDQIEMVQKAKIKQERRQLADTGYTPDSEAIERQNLALEAINDEELTRRILAYSKRTTNPSVTSTPVYEPTTSNNFAKYRPIKREFNEEAEDSTEPTPRKRYA